jgi:hypothetical protein
VKSIFLWLFVINLGIACGAGLYEARVIGPQWMDSPPQTWPNTGLMFWVYMTTVPLTMLTVTNLIAAWMDSSTRRRWWRSAAVITLLERIATFSYFIPEQTHDAPGPLRGGFAGIIPHELLDHGGQLIARDIFHDLLSQACSFARLAAHEDRHGIYYLTDHFGLGALQTDVSYMMIAAAGWTPRSGDGDGLDRAEVLFNGAGRLQGTHLGLDDGEVAELDTGTTH